MKPSSPRPEPSLSGVKRLLTQLFTASLLTVTTALAQPSPPHLTSVPPSPDHPQVRLQTQSQAGTVLGLESSPSLNTWTPVALLHDAALNYPNLTHTPETSLFYRAWTRERTPDDDWKNQILFPEDPFLSSASTSSSRWIKFAILLNDPSRVYYQNSTKFPFHYDFASLRLPPFIGTDRTSFDLASLRLQGQQLVLGTILFPPRPTFVEYGIQFIGLDPYPPEQIAQWFNLVQATVHSTNNATAIYLPAFEQMAAAQNHTTYFESQNITVASLDRWTGNSHVYSTGWALGTLKFFPAADVQTALGDGRLLPTDILLTDGIPTETPLVSGIITLTPSTPNSHTAILARSFNVPFVYLPDPLEQQQVHSLTNLRVILRASSDFEGPEVRVINVQNSLSHELQDQLLALKQPAPIQYTPKAAYGSISTTADSLTPDDIAFFGGKASNFGLLRTTLPTNSPAPAIALSFDLWDAFLDQTLPPAGQSLRNEITSRLAPFTNYPPDMTELQPALTEIRTLITSTAQFSPQQQQDILALLHPFDPNRKIRFRSSTNVEDSDTFTGAGLYDSYSGCLLDDIDNDTSGPSACDPTEANERGVLRAIQRVYASFYNVNAFLERLRHSVNESQVGMAILVHHSFPDEAELANGVATLDCRYAGSPFISGPIVTQLGAESVTNPTGTSRPEVADLYAFSSFTGVDIREYSSLVPLGAFVMNWQDDYLELGKLFRRVADRYHELHPDKDRFTLDLEFKKDLHLGLVIKQVRELPGSTITNQAAPYLIHEPVQWVVAQRESGDVFANHRLKSSWNLQATSMQLTTNNLPQGLFTQGTCELIQNQQITSINDPLLAWPNAALSPDGTSFTWTPSPNTRWTLATPIPTPTSSPLTDILTPHDLEPLLTIDYTQPQPTLSQTGTITTTTQEIAFLEPLRNPNPNDILITRSADLPDNIHIETSFYWPNEEPAAAGYTAPLVRFAQTQISGLTTTPITLTNYYSQTYRPGHHNFTEEFIFEPQLDPNLPHATLTELQTANIQLIHLQLGFVKPTAHILGLDQKLRPLHESPPRPRPGCTPLPPTPSPLVLAPANTSSHPPHLLSSSSPTAIESLIHRK
ncbi:MAG: hypothetical protein RI897_4335 [Verrucomicrobiota bacterium]